MQDADLYILGSGIAFPDHLTLETLDIIARCDRVLTNIDDARLMLLPPDLRGKFISVLPLYRDLRVRTENYRDVANHVISELARHRPLAWMTQGHPTLCDSVTPMLTQGCRDRGLAFLVLPGISSLDAMLAALGHDPSSGLLVCEASYLLTRRVPLPPGVAALILQPSVFGSVRANLALHWRPDLSPLVAYLLQFRPAQHGCALVTAPRTHGDAAAIHWGVLETLDSVPDEALKNATLFIPRPDNGSLPNA